MPIAYANHIQDTQSKTALPSGMGVIIRQKNLINFGFSLLEVTPKRRN